MVRVPFLPLPNALFYALFSKEERGGGKQDPNKWPRVDSPSIHPSVRMILTCSRSLGVPRRCMLCRAEQLDTFVVAVLEHIHTYIHTYIHILYIHTYILYIQTYIHTQNYGALHLNNISTPNRSQS